MHQKLITFAVPCYNSAAYMRHCIETLLSAGEQAEIILVDDGSVKDETPSIAAVSQMQDGITLQSLTILLALSVSRFTLFVIPFVPSLLYQISFFCYAICAFILYCIARESFMTHRFALLFCNGAHRHRGCSACTAFGGKRTEKAV